MQIGSHNLFPLSAAKRKLRDQLCVLALCFTLIFPHHVFAISISEAIQIPAVMNVMAHIVALNMAMEDASRNPQDTRRRERVARAVSLLPAAIMGLAAEFQKGDKLGDSSLPMIQGMLGGFIDQGAPSRFAQFLKKPQAELIPKLGKDFPKNVRPADIDSANLVPKEAAGSAVASSGKGSGKTQAQATDGSGKMASAQTESGNGLVGSAATAAGSNQAKATESFGYDESGTKESASGDGSVDSQTISRRPANDSGIFYPRPAQSVGSQLSEIAMRSTGSRAEVSDDRVFRVGEGSDDSLDGTDSTQARKRFLSSRNKGNRSTASIQERRARLQPKYFNLNPMLVFAESTLLQAHAKEKGEGESGDKAAAILMALAMMVMAIAPMVQEAIRANADKAIARIQSDTTKYTANLQANVVKYNADTTRMISERNTDAAQQISAMNNQGQSDRLNMQIAELRAARQDAQQAEQQKRAIEMQYNQQRIELAQKQADDNLKLARETLNANLTQAGLIPNVSTVSATGGITGTKLGAGGVPVASSTSGAGSGGGISLASAAQGLPGTGFKARGFLDNGGDANLTPEEEELEKQKAAQRAKSVTRNRRAAWGSPQGARGIVTGLVDLLAGPNGVAAGSTADKRISSQIAQAVPDVHEFQHEMMKGGYSHTPGAHGARGAIAQPESTHARGFR